MTQPFPVIKWFYDRILFVRPVLVLAALLAAIGILAGFAVKFEIEASPNTLIQQDNQDYLYYQKIIDRFGYEDFLVIAYTPEEKDLLTRPVLSRIGDLRDAVEAVDGVDSVTTLLDVPLLESPPMELSELVDNIRTLSSPDVNPDLARKELKNSPLYQSLLVSPDLETTALQINLEGNPEYERLWDNRQRLRQKAEQQQQGLSPGEQRRLRDLDAEMDVLWNRMEADRAETIAAIRAVMETYEADADLFLGGISMIASDLMRFIRNDLKVYGIGVTLCLILILGLIFRQVRWVMLPLLSCALSVCAMMGLLGLFGWKVTVVSSNFISLQLIITMAISIHLVVRYRELIAKDPQQSHRRLTRQMVMDMKTPCFYAVLTTIAGFGSLIFADIKPVQTFGWMMAAGILVSLVVTFIFFPAALLLFKKAPAPGRGGPGLALTPVLAGFTQRHGRMVLVISALALAASVAGISRLQVENAFINYFKSSTEIFQGMKVIDRKLGGTTPMDVIIDFEDVVSPPQTAPGRGSAGQAGENPDTEGFDAFSEFEEEADPGKYWFTPYRLSRIEAAHDYLAGMEYTGKVLSLATLKKVAERITGGPLDSFDLSLLFNEFPQKYRRMLIQPFASVAHNQARINVRIIDSKPGLNRDALLTRIREGLTQNAGFAPENIHLTGMLVLYNDVLQSLFESQILTLGLVLLALMVMFLILFRSVKISLIAIFPNLLATAVVLGVMGWIGIPLDIMTITIASVSMGIAVDDTIHYIHRFRREIRSDRSYVQAMHRCHGSIGYAMYYTSIAIIIGFSILATSNFIPTIIFGLFTGLAMFIALVSALTLLPQLILWIKPFGPEKADAAASQ